MHGYFFSIGLTFVFLQSEVIMNAITEIEKNLLMPLKNLQKLSKDSAPGKPLMADLWCHFGKVLVFGVDEEETTNDIGPDEIEQRVPKTISNAKHVGDYWKVSFEEGVNHFNKDKLPKFGDNHHDFFDIKLDRIQWRYDFGFHTPLDRNIRLKVWEGLPAETDEPPLEVKNILKQVFLCSDESIKAWICCPSTSCVRGEIMTPDSEYDCRIKLRAGYRYAEEKDNDLCMKEDSLLSDYLSNCKLDKENHSMKLPDQKDHEMPEGFKCTFY